MKRRTWIALALGVVVGIVLGSIDLMPRKGMLDPRIFAAAASGWVLLLMALSLHALLRKGPDAERPRRARPDSAKAAAVLFHVLVMGAWLLFYFAFEVGPPEAVGIRGDFPPVMAFALGLGVFGILTVGNALHSRWTGRREADLRTSVRANRLLIPRNRSARRVIGAALLINPFAEEFLMRGVCLHLVIVLTGWLSAAVAFGVLSTIVLHAYQGKGVLAFHVVFFGAALALLYSPAGLWAAFGLHFAGDTLPFLMVRRNLRELRALRAARRARESPAPAAA